MTADLRDALRGQRVAAFSIGPSDEVIVLAASADVTVPAYKIRPYSATLITFTAGQLDVRELDAVTARLPIVQPLPDEETLIVSPRSRRHVYADFPNAAVHDRVGSVQREFLLGDGIEDVQTTRDGAIWVSYFDEGIYGNDTWEFADGRPPSSSGLARFDRSGELEWTYEPPVGFGSIYDCCALNVSDGGVWAYYYSSVPLYPLVRVSEGVVDGWPTPVVGVPRFVAASTDRVVLVGVDRAHSLCCVACRFKDGDLSEEGRFMLSTRSGPLRLTPFARKHIAARGTSIYALDGTKLFRLDISDA